MSTGTDPKPVQPAPAHDAVTPKKRRYNVFDYARERMKGKKNHVFPKITAPIHDPRYAGKWLALSADLTTILAASEDYSEASRLADEARPEEQASLLYRWRPGER